VTPALQKGHLLVIVLSKHHKNKKLHGLGKVSKGVGLRGKVSQGGDASQGSGG